MEAARSSGTEGVGHTLILNNDDMERIKNAVVEKVTDVLPGCVADILPGCIADVLPGILVEVFPKVVSQILPNIITTMEENTKSAMVAKKEAERVMKENATKINGCLKERKKLFGQHHRCVSLLGLWDECLEARYIPRKFREDKFHVNDREELEIIKRRSLANLQCQYDLLSKRKPEFLRKAVQKDDSMIDFIESLPISREAKVEASDLWKKKTDIDEESVKQEWEKKIKEMKEAFGKDKETLDERNRSRFGDGNITIRRRTASSVHFEEDDPNEVLEEELDPENPRDFESLPQSADGSAIHGFTNDGNSSGDESDDETEEHVTAASDATQDRLNHEYLASNFTQEHDDDDDEESLFRDDDHRKIPHDFFQLKTIEVDRAQHRRSTSPRF